MEVIIDVLKPRLHRILDKFLDKLKVQTPGDQQLVRLALTDFQEDMNESFIDTLDEVSKTNNLEYSPQLQRALPQLRSRVRGVLVPLQDEDGDRDGAGAQASGESWWDWVCHKFQAIMQMLCQIWQDNLPWLQDLCKRIYEFMKDMLLDVRSALKVGSISA